LVLRVLRARVSHRDAPALFHRVRQFVEARPDGLLDVYWGVQEDERSTSLLMTSTWRDLESIYRVVGGPDLLWDAALFRGIEDRIHDLEVQHYSVLDTPLVTGPTAGGTGAAAPVGGP
jgi:hypothetical protein